MKRKNKGFKISIDDGYTEYTYAFEDITQDHSINDIYHIIRKALNHEIKEGVIRESEDPIKKTPESPETLETSL